MDCHDHAGTPAVGTCTGCAEPFCARCLVEVRGARYCAGCKQMAVAGMPAPVYLCDDAKSALRLAVVGLVIFGIVLEPIAISKALSARRQIAGNPALGGKGRVDAALVVAGVGLLFSLLNVIHCVGGHR
jgi:hypothetical protein